jgi:hypothetical protein
MTLEAPMISSRRKSHWLIFDVFPSWTLPPAEFAVVLAQAENRGHAKVSGGGANASRAVAITGPIPGNGHQPLGGLIRSARLTIGRSNSVICSMSECSVVAKGRGSRRVRQGGRRIFDLLQQAKASLAHRRNHASAAAIS